MLLSRLKLRMELIELFNYLKKLEVELDRKQTKRWEPREIDLDLLFFNDRIFKSLNLTVPHYGIRDRDFVLVPLKEIAPLYFHPALKKKIIDICKEDISRHIIRKTRFRIN